MIELRPFEKLGKSNHGWLNANFHFSFAEYNDPKRVHWGALRVWNNDRIAADSGFPPHPHRDMEIITYVINGAISHEDTLGNAGRTEAGQIQVMSAGNGIRHAEYNKEIVGDRAVPDLDPAQQAGRSGPLGHRAVSRRDPRRQAGADGLRTRP